MKKTSLVKKGVNATYTALADKYGGSMDTYKEVYSFMELYGFSEKFFPERFKIKSDPFATRLTESTIKKLKQIRKESGKTKQKLIDALIKFNDQIEKA